MMAAPVIAGVLYDWRPVSNFSVGLGVLGLSILVTWIGAQKKEKVHSMEKSFESNDVEIEEDA
jgi:hypothetical protein